LITVLIAHQY